MVLFQRGLILRPQSKGSTGKGALVYADYRFNIHTRGSEAYLTTLPQLKGEAPELYNSALEPTKSSARDMVPTTTNMKLSQGGKALTTDLKVYPQGLLREHRLLKGHPGSHDTT